jgi:hypothetical protein
MKLSPNNGLKKMYIGNCRRYTIQKIYVEYMNIKAKLTSIINKLKLVYSIYTDLEYQTR